MKKIIISSVIILEITTIVILLLLISFKTSPVTSNYKNQSSSSINNNKNVNKIITFTNDKLPEVEIKYPEGWIIETKEVIDPNKKCTNSEYIPSCDINPIWVGFKKENVELEIVFNLENISDRIGFQCSNTVNFTSIGNKWYRIKSIDQYYYSNNIKENITTGSDNNFIPGFYGKTGDEWSIISNTQYKLCDYCSQNYLSGIPIVETKGPFFRWYMDNPQIKGNPNEEIIKELDSIILSIKL